MTDPTVLMEAIQADAEALDAASKLLQNLTDRLAAAEIAFEDAMDVALTHVEAEYRQRGEKLPSERQRDAHARQRIDPEIRREFMQLSREAKLIEKWGDMRSRALSARQSELAFLRAEGGAQGVVGQGRAAA